MSLIPLRTGSSIRIWGELIQLIIQRTVEFIIPWSISYSGLDENGHSRFIGNYILQLINIGHVSATHLGNNKYVKCVISNPEDTRLVWRLEDQSNGQDTEFEVYAFELGLEQYNTLKIAADQMPNHKWSGMMKVRMHHSSMKTITTQVIFKRITGNDEWRVSCLFN